MRPLENQELKWICIDFDETIATNSGHPDYFLREPVKGAKQALERLAQEGWKTIIYTARAWVDYQTIEAWLAHYNIPFRRIICGKPLARWIIDDRNIEFDGNWDKVFDKLK